MIKATGLLKDLLLTQLSGLTGHIEECGYPFTEVAWNKEDFNTTNGTPNWWVYEQTAYWLDGYIRCGIVLDDQEVISKARKIIKDVFDNPDVDGYLGPKNLKYGMSSRWPHVVFFRACLALYEYSKESWIVEGLVRHYLNSPYPYRFFRDVLNVEIMLRLYEITNNDGLLSLALSSYEEYNSFKIKFNQIRDDTILSRRKPYVHGVTYNEYSKLGALLYRVTKNKKYLDVSIRAFKTLNDKFLLPGQCNCSCEFTISNYYMECYETCDISDYTWANHYMLEVTKDAIYGDRIEKCVFNAGIGSVLEDFKGLQYFSCANQLVADNHSTHCKFSKGKKWMSYRPNPGTECCAGNVNRFLPNYVLNMFYKEDNKIYLNLFGSADYETCIDEKEVKISQKTMFPYEHKTNLVIDTKTPFTLFIRKPKYAKSFSFAEILKDCEVIEHDNYFELKISKSLQFSYIFEPEIETIVTNTNGIYFQRGVLVYTSGMYGNRVIDETEEKSSKEFPAYNIYPDKEWGYEVKITANPQYFKNNGDLDFKLSEDKSYIEIDAYKIKNADLNRTKVIRMSHVDLFGKKSMIVERGDFMFTPDLLKNEYETEETPTRIKLYPYGLCKLRQTVFKIKK